MSRHKKTSKKNVSQVQLQTFVQSLQSMPVWGRIAIIVVAAFLAYAPSITGGFIMDDDLLLTSNPLIKAADGLFYFWCTTKSPEYYPITNSMFWIEWRLWGMDPIGYHVTNLILHIVEALLIWLILRRMLIPGAFLAAVIFTVHPVNVESVAWIAQLRNVMAMLFFLLSILWYLKYATSKTIACMGSASSQGGPRGRVSSCVAPAFWYWLSLTAFLLAMLSKGSVAILPVLLLGIVWWLRPLTWRDMIRTVPFFAATIALTIVHVWCQTHGSGEIIRNATFVERLLGAGGVVWFYLYKAILPINLAFIYPQWHIGTGNPLWWLSLLAAIALTVVLWLYRRGRSRPLLFVWGFFCVALLPVMGFTDVGFMQYSLVADHYQHIAIIGVIALAAAGWSLCHQQARGKVSWAHDVFAFVLTGILVYLTWQQCGLYRDAITLYQAGLVKNTTSWMLQYNLGNEFFHTGHLSESVEHFKKSLALKPDYFEPHNNLAAALNMLGQYPQSIEYSQQSLKVKSDNPDALSNLGVSLVRLGRPQEAIVEFKRALRLKADNPGVHNNLGNVLVDVGRTQEAIEEFKLALRQKPDYAEAHINLGIALNNLGLTQEAIDHYRQALQLKPDSIEAHANLAMAYAQTGQSSEAIVSARKAIQLARSQGQTAIAVKMESWLESYRAGRDEKK
jgi:tetratricopeptide (TPR) repeat protein